MGHPRNSKIRPKVASRKSWKANEAETSNLSAKLVM